MMNIKILVLKGCVLVILRNVLCYVDHVHVDQYYARGRVVVAIEINQLLKELSWSI
jgi:hypothetical protein